MRYKMRKDGWFVKDNETISWPSEWTLKEKKLFPSQRKKILGVRKLLSQFFSSYFGKVWIIDTQLHWNFMPGIWALSSHTKYSGHDHNNATIGQYSYESNWKRHFNSAPLASQPWPNQPCDIWMDQLQTGEVCELACCLRTVCAEGLAHIALYKFKTLYVLLVSKSFILFSSV